MAEQINRTKVKEGWTSWSCSTQGQRENSLTIMIEGDVEAALADCKDSVGKRF